MTVLSHLQTQRARQRRAFSRAVSLVALASVAALVAGCASEPPMLPPPPLLVQRLPPRVYTFQAAPNPPDVPPSYLVLLPNADGTTGQVLMNSPKGRQTLSRAKQGAGLEGAAPAFDVTDSQLKRDFGAVMAARPTLPERYRIYFALKSSELTAESDAVLKKIIDRSQHFSALEVSVTGHTDRRGEPQANYELGLSRARTLTDLLIARRIRALAIEVGSEGEDMPLVPTPDNTDEPRNRRVEVVLR